MVNDIAGVASSDVSAPSTSDVSSRKEASENDSGASRLCYLRNSDGTSDGGSSPRSDKSDIVTSKGDGGVCYPRIFALRQKQSVDGVDISGLPLEKRGLAHVSTMHHVTRITEGGVVCFRVRVCRTCSGLKQLLELGSCADLESALLLNDVHEIIEGRFSQLQLLVPEDAKYFKSICVRKRGSTDDTPVMNLINERLWKNHTKRFVQSVQTNSREGVSPTPSTSSKKRLRPDINNGQTSALQAYDIPIDAITQEPNVNPLQNFCEQVTTGSCSSVLAFWTCRSWNLGASDEARAKWISLIEEFQVALFQIFSQDTSLASMHAAGLNRTVAALSIPRAIVFSLLASQFAGNDMKLLQHMFRRLHYFLPKHDSLRIGELRSLAILIGLSKDPNSPAVSPISSVMKARKMMSHANMGFFIDSLRRYLAYLDNAAKLCVCDGVLLDGHEADIRILGFHKQIENCVIFISEIATTLDELSHDTGYSLNPQVNDLHVIARNVCGVSLCGTVALCGTSCLLWKLQGDRESVLRCVNISNSNLCQGYYCFREETVNSRCLYSSARLMATTVANMGSSSGSQCNVNLVQEVLAMLVGDSTYAIRVILHIRPLVQLPPPVLENGLISRIVANLADMESYFCACVALMQFISCSVREACEEENWEAGLLSTMDTVLGPQLQPLNAASMDPNQHPMKTLFELLAYTCEDMIAELERMSAAPVFSLTSCALLSAIEAAATISRSFPQYALCLSRVSENCYCMLRNLSRRFVTSRLLLESLSDYSRVGDI
mmetsp:Transcript_10800/g.16431  ORF Transcript_10800/g.16431 Transcript_10800/m.16431 type:complete len:776 (+) Transcript_10800:56-2383(+)|eukprot:CAMPEP_0185018152 /NCGR_PEP_ID=MMETSP1103-20130426/971_1 /TAXON_ID=36769 /ORGANISM="Paraphysomonas bandaiensis, Strain Caron Lab Isolate" /LENGTH=775 /DNA_ID=CAMNT_0027547869 /DNA_START=43 /DNA_END=2370 /DNA_ORIENTATION=-